MASPMPSYKTEFLQKCIAAQALRFGTFTLKSGRQSPYFFNAGLFHRADLLGAISAANAHTLAATGWEFEVVFGPAYKGIPLAVGAVDKLAQLDGARFGAVSYSFNRKEAKDHGEGGSIVGAGLAGKRVVIVDDVITAGTAIREAIDIIRREGGHLVGIAVAFDRLEKTPAKDGEDEAAPRRSAIGQVREEFGVPVVAILTLDDVVESLRAMGSQEDLKRLEEYREKYRASD
ncbi:orotate phosphoribosyltransferase [Verruconis gallopava]|uniref:Orotate phosphoribosyltransferase n=1 Tax=Verruconis gallopava TaxID=253628 RepID=A0A0D2B4G6_9PEZI|nr:orotate phosphoribosyltransferase [Verruconis gallopava]KIW06119.1 orotate phosphoribosyltransferase [Verruconis gallopava]